MEDHFEEYHTLKTTLNYHANRRTNDYRDLKTEVEVKRRLYIQAQSQLFCMEKIRDQHKKVQLSEELRVSAENQAPK